MNDKKLLTFFENLGIEINSDISEYLSERSVEFTAVNWDNIAEAPVGQIQREDFDLDIIQLILKRYFGGEGALASDEQYQSILEKSGSLKVMSGKSLGAYSDVLASLADEEGLNLNLIRNFSLQLFSFLAYLEHAQLISYPIEVDYGCSKEAFFLQVHCGESDLYLENLLDATNEEQHTSPYCSLLRELSTKVNFLEIYKIKSTSRFVLTGVWKLKQETIPRSSLLIHQIEKFENVLNENIKLDTKTLFTNDPDKIHKIRAIEKTPIKYCKDNAERELYNPILVKRIITFLKRKNEVVEGVLSGDIDKIKIRGYIEDFPDKEAIAGLNDHDIEQILISLGDGLDEVEEQVKNLSEQISEEDYIEGIVNSIAKMTSEEAKSAIGYDEADIRQIKGQREDLGEEAIKIAGEGKAGKEETTRIEGVTESFKDGPWRVKRLDIAEKVRANLSELEAKGTGKEEIDRKIQAILRNELNLKEDEGEMFTTALSDDATDDWVRGGLDAVNESIKQRIKLQKVQEQLQMRNNQVIKMKKLIDNMKNELLNKQKEAVLGQGGQEGFRALKGSDENISILQKENNNLKSQVESLKERMHTMYEKSKESGAKSFSDDDVQRISGENTTLKAQKRTLNQEYESLKMEKREIEQRLKTLGAENERLKIKIENKKMGQEERQQMIEKDREIERLKNEVKGNHDEIKAYQLKGKSYEQKIKFMSAQIEKSNSSKQGSSPAAPTVNEKKLANKLKHAETSGTRLKETVDKLNKELSEKKTELHKTKLEVKTTAGKVKELEKKLIQSEKKRAA